ncbi:MAG: hypothetical protein WAV50_00990 [Minisyncoccia bacterium]
MKSIKLPISLEDLARLALLRRIPGQLDEAWKTKFGVSPMDTSLRRREARGQTTLLCIVIALCIVLLFEGVGYWVLSDKHPLAGILLSVPCAILVILVTSLVLFHLSFEHEYPSLQEVLSIEQFCGDLSEFCKWSGIAPHELAWLGYERLKHATDRLLECEAYLVMKHDRTNHDMSTKYDTLRRLGLVAEGGYAKYFEEAKKRLESKE